MKLYELYPYWRDVHQELVEAASLLNAAQLDAKPSAGALSIREIATDFIFAERYVIAHLVGRNDYERPRLDDTSDAAAIVDAINATRAITDRVLAPFGPDGLRAVRNVPADVAANRPETNMPIAWLIWHLLEQEISALSQIQLRLADARKH